MAAEGGARAPWEKTKNTKKILSVMFNLNKLPNLRGTLRKTIVE